MTYENAQYLNDQDGNPSGIRIEINGVVSFVPLASGNTDYDKIMALVAEGQLTIQDAPAPPAPIIPTKHQPTRIELMSRLEELKAQIEALSQEKISHGPD